MSDGKRIVWGISYTTRLSWRDRWCKKWTGPVGIYAFGGKVGVDAFRPAHPVFFRTRKQAREKAKELGCTSGGEEVWWCKLRVDKYELSWRKIK